MFKIYNLNDTAVHFKILAVIAEFEKVCFDKGI